MIAGWTIAAAEFVIIIAILTYFFRKKRLTKKPGLEVITNAIALSKPSISSSRIIKLSDVSECMKELSKDLGAKLKLEYEELVSIIGNQAADVGLMAINKEKNRHKSIRPYNSNRVKLSMVNNKPGSDYINASYISGVSSCRDYIATQAPLPGTKADFWRLVWEQNCRSIVMITQTDELENHKSDIYWPCEGESFTSRDLTITWVSESLHETWRVREFNIAKGSVHRRIQQFNFFHWPDHGLPESPEDLVTFARFVGRCVDSDVHNNGPLIVHSSAGAGRTGSYIAIDHMMQHLQEHSTVDIFGIVYQIRMQRMGMVENEKQYMLLHNMVQEFLAPTYEVVFNNGNRDHHNSSAYETSIPRSSQYENTV